MFARFPSISVLLLFIAVISAAPVSASPDLGEQLLNGLSHLAPHLLDLFSPNSTEPSVLPPASLLTPLREKNEQFTKGLEPDQEQILASALLSLPLRQQLLKVAVADAGTKHLALIKLQAGDARSGIFRINDLQDDAVSALRVAFAMPLQLDQVDLWSVVPGQDATGSIHRPVFSLCADRQAFTAADDGPKAAKDILRDLGLVRYAPEFLRYAGGEQVAEVAPLLPDTAWSVAPVGDTWSTLETASGQDPRLKSATVSRVVVNIPVNDNSVALTIDDGPHPLITSLFLDILHDRGIQATFFVVGEKVEECPELLRRMVAEGHEIGNHTYSHPRLGQVSDVAALTQIRAGALAIGKVAGVQTRLLRPPGGGIAEHVLRAATAANCTVVLWTHNSNDWTKPAPEEIAANALRNLKPGSIILMHQGDIESVRALPLIIDGVRERGLRLTTVGDMISRAPVPALPITQIMSLYQRHQLEKE